MRRALVCIVISLTAATWVAPAFAQDEAEPNLLRVGILYDLYTSNPLRACGCGAEYRWMTLQYDMLLNFDPETQEAAPGIATEVPSVDNGGISEDHLTYTFHIRDDATWQDGEPLTARTSRSPTGSCSTTRSARSTTTSHTTRRSRRGTTRR